MAYKCCIRICVQKLDYLSQFSSKTLLVNFFRVQHDHFNVKAYFYEVARTLEIYLLNFGIIPKTWNSILEYGTFRSVIYIGNYPLVPCSRMELHV